MKRIDFKREVSHVCTFLSVSKELEEMTEYGQKTYNNYTVLLNKYGTINAGDDKPKDWESVNQKFVLQATNLLQRELISRNVEPGCVASITMRSKPGDKAGTGPVWWEVKVAPDKVDIVQEEPGEVDKVGADQLVALHIKIGDQLLNHYGKVAEQGQFTEAEIFSSINTVFMTSTKLGIFE